MDRDQIISKVKYKLDEAGSEQDEEVVKPGVIDEFLDPAAKQLYTILPTHLIPLSEITANPASAGDGVGTIDLDSDFLKLAAFQLTDWERPVITPIKETDPRYLLQKNAHTRGGKSKPVAVLRHDGTNQILEYYTSDTHSKEVALYVPIVEAKDVDESLIEPYTWLIAANIFQVYERHKDAEQAQKKVQEFIAMYM